MIATVTALVASARALGGSLGGVVFSTIYNNKVPGKLAELVTPAVTALGYPAASLPVLLTTLRSRPTAISTLPSMTPDIAAAATAAYQQATTQSYSLSWYSVVPFVFIAVVGMLCLQDVKKESESIKLGLSVVS